MNLQKSISRLRNSLTRIYARYGIGKIEKTSEYSAHGHTSTVYWFDSDSKKAGHTTPLNTILMNKKPFQDLSQEAQDYVFLHELGHAKVPTPINLLLYVFLIPSLVAALLSPFAAASQVIRVGLATNSVKLTLISLIAGITVVIAATGIFIFFSWLSEGHAELHALHQIGKQEYLEVSKEISEYADRGTLRTLRHRIQYPPPRLIAWLSQRI